MAEDEELKRIRLKKMGEFMSSSSNENKPECQGAVLNKPIIVSDATFAECVHKHPLVVIDCWASWCGPCQMVAPVIEELARNYAGKIVFGKLNVDENQRTAMKYGIMSIPTLLIFKSGKLVDQVIGAMPRQILEPQITKYLNKELLTTQQNSPFSPAESTIRGMGKRMRHGRG